MSELFGAFFWSCLVIYALMVAAQVYGQVFSKPKWVELAPYGVLAGLILHTVLVAWRWIATGHVPTIGNFENGLIGGWFIVVMTLWAGWKQRYPLLAAGALPFALLIMGGGAMSDTSARPMIASLDSFWLYIHIFFAWLAYGAYSVAAALGVVHLLRSRAAPRELPPLLERLPEPPVLDDLMFRSIVFGFIGHVVMIATGAIWARDLWGNYWGWDPVETWSLLSALLYGLWIHLRVGLHWRGRRMAWLAVAALSTVLFAFWGTSMMGGTSHSLDDLRLKAPGEEAGLAPAAPAPEQR